MLCLVWWQDKYNTASSCIVAVYVMFSLIFNLHLHLSNSVHTQFLCENVCTSCMNELVTPYSLCQIHITHLATSQLWHSAWLLTFFFPQITSPNLKELELCLILIKVLLLWKHLGWSAVFIYMCFTLSAIGGGGWKT